MTAPTRAEVVKGLDLLRDAIDAGRIPVPSPCWPLVIHAAHPGELVAVARTLGLGGSGAEVAEEEDGSEWLRLRGYVGGVLVEVTADARARILDAPGGAR